MPRWYRRKILEPVLHDLQLPHPVDLVIELEEKEPTPTPDYGPMGGGVWVMFSERGQPGSFGVGLPKPGVSRAQAQVSLADQLQEQFFPEMRAAWGQARPTCPGHGHPAQPVELDRAAWWQCPIDGRRIGRFGELATVQSEAGKIDVRIEPLTSIGSSDPDL
jgi:hypothetical protein